MRIITTDNLKDTVSQLKCHMEAGLMRLTFLWPEDVEQVYIFKTGEHFNIEDADPASGRLFTLQEYKKQGGYTCPRPSGAFTYRIYPFIRKDGCDYAFVYTDKYAGDFQSPQNSIEVCGQIPIQVNITEKSGFLSKDKTYIITLLAQQAVEGDILCYVKKLNGYPATVNDGMMYFFGNGLEAGLPKKWEVKVKKNEYIRVFVRDPVLAGIYCVEEMHSC